MARRHVQEYYEQICDQYHEMLENIHELEQDMENEIVEPEYIDKLKQQIQPVKDTYMTISWIMYLLNQPNKKEKERPYQKRMKKYLSSLDTSKSTENTIINNKKVIDSIKNQ